MRRLFIFFILFFSFNVNIKSQDTILFKKKISLHFAFTNARPSFSKVDYNLNNQLLLRFFVFDLWSHHAIEAGILKPIRKNIYLKTAFGYSNTRQFVKVINYLADDDRNTYGFGAFDQEVMSYRHEHLFLNIGTKVYLKKFLLIEPSFSTALNISKNFYGYDNTNYPPFSYYKPIYNLAKTASNIKYFGNLFAGFEFKNIIFGINYETTLSQVKNKFMYRGQQYNIRYAAWESLGLRFGYTINNRKSKFN